MLVISLALFGSNHASAGQAVISQSLDGWTTFGSGVLYDVAADPAVQYDGAPSVAIRAHAGQTDIQKFAASAQYFDATPFVGERVRFSAYVKTDGAASGGLWMRVDGDAGFLAFDNMGDRPIVGTTDWKQYSVVLDIPVGSRRVVYGALLSGAGTLWISKPRVEVVGSEVAVTQTPAPSSPTPDASSLEPVVRQVRAAAIPISGDDPTLALNDLLPLRAIVGDAHIVALGEGSHGTAQFFNMKDRMLRYLVEKMGFTVFAIEANWSDALAVDDYIKTGHGSARDALAGLGFWTWNTQEVLDLIQWMRAYNAAPGPHPQLSFAGFDLQAPAGAYGTVINYVKRHDPSDLGAVERDYACFSQTFSPAPASTSAGAACRASVARVSAMLDAKRAQLVKQSSNDEFLTARNAADIVEQAQSVNAGVLDRDAAMAKDVQWLMRKRYPGQKIVLWAHNGHVAAAPGGLSYQTMGSHLRKTFGADMVVFGMTFDSGSVRAVPMQNGHPSGGPTPLPVPSAGPGFSEYVFHATQMPAFILALHGIPASSPLGQWLALPQKIEMISVYDPALPRGQEVPMVLPDAFDALVYFDTSDASAPLPPRPPAMRNLTVLPGSAGAQLGTAWTLYARDIAHVSAGSDTKIKVADTPSLFLDTSSDASAASDAGLNDNLDVQPYLGKRMRIWGLMKTQDVVGTASCWLNVSGANRQMLASDFMLDRRTHGTTSWTPFMIVVDVPAQSLHMVFGLALNGTGRMWIDNVRIDIVGSDVPLTSKG